MSKKGYPFILIIVLLVIFAGLWFFHLKNNTKVSSQTVSKAPAPQVNTFSILTDTDFSASTTLQHYTLGPVTFSIYPLVQSASAINPGHFEVDDNGQKVFSSTPNYNVNELIAFTYNQNTYVVVDDYSGGAHCCDTDYLFRINPQNQVKLIKTLDMGNNSIIKSSLLFQNNTLYFVLGDDRFAYFHAPFAESYFFSQYYKLEGDNLVLANSDFAAEFTKNAQVCQTNLTQDLANVKSDPTLNLDSWIPDLLCKVTSDTLAGNSTLAWQGFENYFAEFGAASPASVEDYDTQKPVVVANLKKEIMDTLNQQRF